jgi:biopolymer transport protein ExbD
MRRIEHPQIELQIAPLIDVCFLLLFFYILTSRPAQPEGMVPASLPGTAAVDDPLEIPDEQHLTILANGQVLANEQPLDPGSAPDLPMLRSFLSRLYESAAAHKGRLLVTVDAADNVPLQRLLEVLNACARAGIASVSFATNTEETR